MSGGSFNYLCYAEDLSDRVGSIEDMARHLEEYLGAEDAAVATRGVVAKLKQANDSADVLREVWKAVEWWQSGDWAKDQAAEALAEWRCGGRRRRYRTYRRRR